MGDGTKENPFTREDVLKLIEENGGTARGLDLSGKVFEQDIDLFGLDLSGIILRGATFPTKLERVPLGDILPFGRNIFKSDVLSQIPRKIFAVFPATGLAAVKLEGADLSFAKLSGINMSHAQLQRANLEYANLTNAYMGFADLRNADLSNAQLQATCLRSAKMDGAYLFESQFSHADLRFVDWGNYVLGEEKEKHFRMAAISYRELKLLYDRIGFHDIAGEFFYREMECKWKALHPFWLGFFRVLCGYGERPWRVLLSALFIILGLAVAYHYLGTFSSKSFLDALYYSVISFTALGYGNWAPQPMGWTKAMGAVEAVIGVFMMALFLVTFVRKMTR